MPEKYRDLAAYVAILALVFAFFADATFGGKTFLTEGDNVAFHSFIPYLNAAKESGEFPLWVPYIFSGMPSLASFLAAGERSWDFVTMLLFMIPRTLGEVMNDTARLAMWYTIYGWGVYTLMRAKDMRRGVAFFSATAAVFSTWVLVWVMIGHNIKPVSLATLPWLLLALERVRTKFTVLNMLWVLLPMVVLVGATHPQMMFYMGCAAALYMLVELVDRTLTKQDPVSVLRAAGVLAIATIIALATHADAFLATRAYTPYSTRGSAPISQSLSNKQDETGGNDYEYATNWSFSPEETITFFVPNYYGFGKTKDTRGLSMTYWGQMPFTDAANYMGIGVLLLALIGAITRWRDPFVLFLIVLGVFSYLLSMGKNFPLVYDIFYNLVPTFNKFRAPSMALVLLQFATPVLAGFGVASVIGWSEKLTPERKRAALIALGGAAAFLVIGLIYTNAMEQSYKNNVVEALMAKDPRITDKAQIPASYTNKMHDMMASDWMATGMLALGFGLLVYLTATKKVSHKVALGALIALTLIDLWRVDKRPYDPSKDSLEKTTFRQTDLISLLKQDKSMYRVADLGTMPPNALAYHFIEHVHGYSSAKLRVYQDMLDEAGNGGGSSIMNPFLWNMLNVKYLIAGQQIYQNVPPDFQSQETGQLLYVNRTAMPRAWFVNRVQQSDQRTILKHLKDGDFDLRDVAFVEGAVGDVQPTDSTATAQATRIGNQHLSVKVTAPQKNFLVVSEVFYPEWHAFVDGQEVPMHKTNFLIRGVVVPAGTHTVEFKYVSPSFETGRTISLAANGLIIIIAALGFWMERRSRTAQAA